MLPVPQCLTTGSPDIGQPALGRCITYRPSTSPSAQLHRLVERLKKPASQDY